MAGGGIGEAALLSAALGGGKSLLFGGDPLQGAIQGAMTGALTGGLGAAASPAAEVAGAAATPTLDSVLASGLPASSTLEAAAPAAGAAGWMGEGDTLGALGGLSNPAALGAGAAATPPPAADKGVIDSLADWWDSQGKTQKRIMMGGAGLGGLALLQAMNRRSAPMQKPYDGPLSKQAYNPAAFDPNSSYLPMYRPSTRYAAGGIMAGHDPYTSTPQDGTPGAATDWQARSSPLQGMANGGIAGLGAVQPPEAGGIAGLGTYSDGGRLLKGPGDGMSDNIPAVIGGSQPARLAEGEFVVPADVVSHLGNGSTDAGAKQLYAMMDKVRHARTGTKKQGKQINPRKYVPA